MKLHIRSTLSRISALSSLGLILAGVAIFGLLSCSRAVMSDEEASQWIAAYTPAHIDMASKIRIEMTDAMKAKIKTKKGLEDYFDFSPSVKGTAKISADSCCIDFTPKESLKPGRRYECRIKMKELTDVDSLGDFRFKFVVDKREMRLTDVVATIDPDDIAMMTVTGRMEWNFQAGDTITADSIVLVSDYPGVKITVDKRVQNKSRRFTIAGIKRVDMATKLTISTNPLIGVSKIDETVEIPALADFKLLNAQRVEAAEPYLNLDFSAPLSSSQELEGLITIDRVSDMRIDRDGTNVKVFYPQNGITDITLRISDLIKNHEGRRLDESIERHFKQEVIPPALEIPVKGNILPDNNNLKLPFRAVNLAAVDVEVVKIFPHNVMSFLQESDLGWSHELRRFGRLIYHKTVRLDKDKSLNLHQWQNFAIDLKGLFRQERGAIYNIRLSFRKAFSLFDQSETPDFEEVDGVNVDENAEWDESCPYIYRETPDRDWGKYNWNEANDPAKPSYYMNEDRMPEHNVVATDLGMIVKKGADNKYLVAVTNLMSASPAAGIEVAAYNYQLQRLATSHTDSNGFATIKTDSKPFLIAASDGRSTTYLKVTSGHELSTSNFDVSGKEITHGIKGFTYGDRGVWRPGDDLHLTLILEDKENSLPKDYPVVMELYNPAEQLYTRQTLNNGVDGFYVFHIPIDENVPTGTWEAQFKAGNQTFTHKVRIETIKPNRLKINIHTPEVIQANQPQKIGLDAHWLTGPVTKDMPATMELTLYADPTPFAGLKKYQFSNPLVTFTSSHKQILSGRLDSIGSITKPCTIGADINTPGMLRANVTAKVTEPGGDASITSRSVQFSPFGVYVGIDLGDKEYLTDTDLKFPVVVVNQKGCSMKTRDLSYKIYRLDWNWWWEGTAEDLSRYVKSSSADLVASGNVTAKDGHASIPFRVEYPNWGKYLVIVRDTKGGHATGGTILIDWPDWRGRAEGREAAGSTELAFTLDKKSYEAGETANIYLPKCAEGKVLLSVENGSRVIKRFWANTSATGETCIKLPIDSSIAPNFYVSATMLRPHAQTENDVPIRLYGVSGATVIDKRTILHPEITMPDELHPGEQFTIRVREQDNKPMTYTLAIVDEGLLDISNFKTPRPWPAMNQREALGVRTWDMYDDITGAFGSKFRSILSIGGDEALRKSAGKEKRFNPVVKFIGPFTLKSGSKSHKITLPNYVGSVRVMVVAAHKGTYGNADKTVKVTSPLMLLSTLPRTLACGDEVDMPVNVFAMQEGIKNVSVNIETTGPISISGTNSKNVAFASVGEKLVDFKLLCDKSGKGKARIIVNAVLGSHRMSDTTYVDVSNPMPLMVNDTPRTLKAVMTTTFTWDRGNTESVKLQIAGMSILNLSGTMEFFENYPHLCTEQLSSKAMFMLYGRNFLDVSDKSECEKHLPTVLKYIQGRQLPDGGFAYWPGMKDANSWVTSMAGVAMAEAERQGISVYRGCFDKWVEYQKTEARDYRYSAETDLDQAFRLYSLAVAGKQLTSAMNRLRESKKLSQAAAYCLASAYAVTGRTDVAAKLIERADRTPYSERGDMFQSSLRDEAIKMQAYAFCNKTTDATTIARKIASQCTGANYITQDLAFATMAFNDLAKLIGVGSESVRVTESGKTPIVLQNFGSVKNLLLSPSSRKVTVANTGKGTLELSLVTTSRPLVTEKVKASSKGIYVAVTYTDMKGKPINVTNLKQDTEFYAHITVKNISGDIDAVATTFTIPSGWELWNSRLYDGDEKDTDYCDIRDDRISYYGSLVAGKSVTYKVRLRAAYIGQYLLPSAIAEDMYNPACRAITANSWVKVIK